MSFLQKTQYNIRDMQKCKNVLKTAHNESDQKDITILLVLKQNILLYILPIITKSMQKYNLQQMHNFLVIG